ncbi:MAG TPA: AIR synthase-related protein [Nitrososphaerales archaeon]|nr:AIR synthase-related protein [Nitrososphaerales archaeon]
MQRVVYSSLGKRSEDIELGPGIGLDNGVISIGRGQVMILTVDPVSVIPAFGMKMSAWLSVHLIASDYTTSGSDPEYALFTYNFPAEMRDTDREEYVRAIGAECDNLGVTIAGGHTGSYPGSGLTVIGSGSMLGFAAENGYVAPSMAHAGDAIVMTKHAAIEATCSLATSFPAFVESKAGAVNMRRAREQVKLCSTVADARAARSVGIGAQGVSAMHDATEGGVLGALYEMAVASEKRFVVHTGGIPVAPESRAVCEAFGLDPLKTMGEGALLITCLPKDVRPLRDVLGRAGVESAEIGSVERGEGLVMVDSHGHRRAFAPCEDGYWSAYTRALGRRLQ